MTLHLSCRTIYSLSSIHLHIKILTFESIPLVNETFDLAGSNRDRPPEALRR